MLKSLHRSPTVGGSSHLVCVDKRLMGRGVFKGLFLHSTPRDGEQPGREWSAVLPVLGTKKKKVAWWMEAAAEHVTGARALTPLSPPAHLPVLVYKQRLSINRRCLPYQSVAGPFVVRGLSARLVCRPRSALVLGAEGQYLLFVPIDRTPGFSAIGIT